MMGKKAGVRKGERQVQMVVGALEKRKTRRKSGKKKIKQSGQMKFRVEGREQSDYSN